MKTLYKLAIVGVVVLALGGCFALGVFDPSLGGTADAAGDATTEAGIITNSNSAESGSDPQTYSFTFAGITATLTNTTAQTVVITFANGTVDTDANAAIPGLSIYSLTDAALATDPYTRSTTPISYTASVTRIGADSEAMLSLDLTGASDLIEFAMDSTLITANGGTRLFNQDGDGTAGEADDDSYFWYEAVGGGTPVTVGDMRDPTMGVTYTLPTTVNAANAYLDVIGFAAGGYNDVFTTASLAGFSVWTYVPSTGVWTQEAVTPTLPATDTLRLGLSDVPSAGEIYQVRYDDYMNATSVARYGYIQRASTEQDIPGSRYGRTDLLVEGDPATYATVNLASTNDAYDSFVGSYYVQVYFQAGVGDIVPSTLTNSSVAFYMDLDGVDNNYVQILWQYFTIPIGTDGANQIRFYFGPDAPINGSTDWEMYLFPAVMDDNLTPADTTDDLPILNITASSGAPVTNDSGNF